MISNQEIIRFSNWCIGAAFKPNWKEKQLDFKEFLKNWDFDIDVIMVDDNLLANHIALSTVPYLKTNLKAVGVYTDLKGEQ